MQTRSVRPRGYKKKVHAQLSCPEHEISNAFKYKDIKKFSFFQAQISLECYFSSAHKFEIANNC